MSHKRLRRNPAALLETVRCYLSVSLPGSVKPAWRSFLWRGGISFGGVVGFIFADLIVLPVLDIYRKYYGWRVMGYVLLTFYITMAADCMSTHLRVPSVDKLRIH